MNRLLHNLTLVVSGVLAAGLIWFVSSPPRGAPVQLRPAPTAAPLVVHVTGAVAEPGVYELPAGSRVRDALEAAGGVMPEADPGALNQAAILADGEQVAVPAAAAASGAPDPSVGEAPGGPAAGGLVDINTATLAQLEALPGIGPSIAQRIIDHREANGPFETAADIVDVSGIGPSTYAAIKDLITAAP